MPELQQPLRPNNGAERRYECVFSLFSILKLIRKFVSVDEKKMIGMEFLLSY